MNTVRRALGRCTSDLAKEVSGRIPKIDAFKYKTVSAKAPLRIECGGWSDMPLYAKRHGGLNLNMAIDIDGASPAAVSARVISRPIIELVIISRTGRIEKTIGRRQAPLAAAIDNPFCLFEKALGVSGFISVNAGEGKNLTALNNLGAGVRLTIQTSLPIGTGLGTSSILCALTLKCLFGLGGVDLETQDLCLLTMYVEHLAGIYGGLQDQVAGLLGGVNYVAWHPAENISFSVDRLQLPANFPDEFVRRTILFNTRTAKSTRQSVERLARGIISSETAVLRALAKGKELHRQMRVELEKGNYIGFGLALQAMWENNTSILDFDPKIDAVFDAVKEHVLGGIVVGSGPCILFVSDSEFSAKAAKRRLAATVQQGDIYAYSINLKGAEFEKQKGGY